jgi:hypothetical protein
MGQISAGGRQHNVLCQLGQSDQNARRNNTFEARLVIRAHTCIYLICLLILAALALVAGCASSPQVTATHSPTATATATLTPLPAGTPTTQDRFAALAQQAIGGMTQQLQTTYDAQAETVVVTATLGGTVANTPDTISARQEQVKTLCLRMQAALWTSGLPLRTATVTVLGPVLDQYTELTTQPYGTAMLSKAKAATLNWNSLTPDVAWGLFENTWLRPQYNDSD